MIVTKNGFPVLLKLHWKSEVIPVIRMELELEGKPLGAVDVWETCTSLRLIQKGDLAESIQAFRL